MSIYFRRKFMRIGIPCLIIVLIYYKLSQVEVKEDQGEVEGIAGAYQAQHGGSDNRGDESYMRKEPYLTPGVRGNFEPPDDEGEPPDGPGEGGVPYHLPPGEEKDKGDASIMEYSMNMVVSNKISLTRSVKDTRNQECKYWNYPTKMGLRASVVIVFNNEGFSTLMRNVHTVIKRSPPEMLEEVLLVDDYCDKDDLQEDLDEYIKRFDGKVRLIRNEQRLGLIRARNIGAQNSKGDVVVFLDAHCEVNRNWLPPLLAPIYLDEKTMTVPFIDGVDFQTFEYRPVYGAHSLPTGIFEWGMFYKEQDLPPEEVEKRPHKSAPYKSPTHAGGLFAISRKYFKDLGWYDPMIGQWGGENFELSFKIWQCGGTILWVPCSRVGHVYRGGAPGGTNGNLWKSHQRKPRREASVSHSVLKNYKRAIDVWFDDKHREFFYAREPLARYLDVGDLSEQFKIKDQLKCKDFQWFMDNVAHNMLREYPELPPNKAWGEMKNKGANKCLDSFQRHPDSEIGVSHCHGWGGSQLMRLNTEGQLGTGERCIALLRGQIMITVCPKGKVGGDWRLNDDGTFEHTPTSKCLEVSAESKLFLDECDSGNEMQLWSFKELRPS